MDRGAAELHKLYYRIGEVAEIVGVEPHVLRYWETEFRSIRPQKSRKGQRIYSRRDVEKLVRVKDLLYVQGFTIAGARKRLREAGVEPAPRVEAAVTPGPGADPVPTILAERWTEAQRSADALRTTLLEVRGDVAALLAELGDDPGAD